MALPDPIKAMKEQLVREIHAILGDRNQHVAARVLGIDQPRMSDLRRGRLERLSLEKLIRILAHIDRRVDMTVVNVGPPRLRIWHFPKRDR